MAGGRGMLDIHQREFVAVNDLTTQALCATLYVARKGMTNQYT